MDSCSFFKSKFIKLTLFFGIILFSNRTSKAEEFEIWTFVGAGTQCKNIGVSLSNARFFVPESGWFLNFTQVSFDLVSNKSINFGIAYKQEYVKNQETIRTGYRPIIHAYYKKVWANFEFQDRNRLEFLFLKSGLENLYRNRLLLSYNKFAKISPYVSTEFFFCFNEFGYVRQRSIVGVNIPIKSVKLNLFGGHQVYEFSPELWHNKFLFGTSLNYSF